MTETTIPKPRRSNRRDDRGATLILALVFIIVVSVIVAAISELTLNDLGNTNHFNETSSLTYSASSVANLAIQSVRYTPQSTAGVLGECWTTGSTPSEWTFDNTEVEIWCQSIENPGSSQTRVVNMYACQPLSGMSPTICQQNPLLTVVEAYDDYSQLGTDTCLANPSNATCGFGATTLAWTWGSIATATGGLTLNAIDITSTAPPSPTPGVTTYKPTATATSGDEVTIASVTPTTCTITNGIVNFIGAANSICNLDFTDPGNFNYAPAPELSQSITLG